MIPENEESVTISHRLLTVDDILSHGKTTSLTILRCSSKCWEEIGVKLSHLPELHTLKVLQCKTGDVICKGLCGSASLLHLCFSKE